MFIQAKHFRNANRDVGDIHRVVIHTAEIQERRDAAEDVANFFATTSTPVSAHKCIDNDTVVDCVRFEDIAFHALGDNDHTIGFELSGFAGQSFSQWRDEYSDDVVKLAAEEAAKVCKRYGIPVRWLTPEQEAARAKGIVSHKVVSDVHGAGSRSDPGEHFPVTKFLALVTAEMGPPPAPDKLKYVLIDGEGNRLAASQPVGAGETARKARLESFLGSQIDALDAEFERDKKAGQPEDVRIVRVNVE